MHKGSNLHPNAGARFRAEVNLLPITLLNPSPVYFGGHKLSKNVEAQ
jgi:hypothetical protein